MATAAFPGGTWPLSMTGHGRGKRLAKKSCLEMTGGWRRPSKMEGFTYQGFTMILPMKMLISGNLPMKMLISGNLPMKNADCGDLYTYEKCSVEGI